MSVLKDVKTVFKSRGTNYTMEFDLTQLVAELDTRSEDVAKRLYDLTQVACPVDTGRMKASARLDKTDLGEYDISYNTEYASYTEWREGTSCSHWFSNAIYNGTHVLQSLWERLTRGF